MDSFRLKSSIEFLDDYSLFNHKPWQLLSRRRLKRTLSPLVKCNNHKCIAWLNSQSIHSRARWKLEMKECIQWAWQRHVIRIFMFFSRVLRDSTPRFVGRSVCRSVGRSHFTFFMIFIFGPHCSCPNGLVTSNMAPAHPHATSVAVYPALLIFPSTFSCPNSRGLSMIIHGGLKMPFRRA